jgi:hypothetical protein
MQHHEDVGTGSDPEWQARNLVVANPPNSLDKTNLQKEGNILKISNI